MVTAEDRKPLTRYYYTFHRPIIGPELTAHCWYVSERHQAESVCLSTLLREISVTSFCFVRAKGDNTKNPSDQSAQQNVRNNTLGWYPRQFREYNIWARELADRKVNRHRHAVFASSSLFAHGFRMHREV